MTQNYTQEKNVVTGESTIIQGPPPKIEHESQNVTKQFEGTGTEKVLTEGTPNNQGSPPKQGSGADQIIKESEATQKVTVNPTDTKGSPPKKPSEEEKIPKEFEGTQTEKVVTEKPPDDKEAPKTTSEAEKVEHLRAEKPQKEDTEAEKEVLKGVRNTDLEKQKEDTEKTEPTETVEGQKPRRQRNTRKEEPQKRLTLQTNEKKQEDKNKKRLSQASYDSLTDVLTASDPSRNWEGVFDQFKKAQDNKLDSTGEKEADETVESTGRNYAKKGKKRSRAWEDLSSSSTDAWGGNWESCWSSDWSWVAKSSVHAENDKGETDDTNDWDSWYVEDWWCDANWGNWRSGYEKRSKKSSKENKKQKKKKAKSVEDKPEPLPNIHVLHMHIGHHNRCL